MQIPMWDLPIVPENRTAQRFREDLLYHDNVEKGGIVSRLKSPLFISKYEIK